MPSFVELPEAALGICAYETTTEGTPISPVFPNTDDGKRQLIRYCSEHQTVFADHAADPRPWAQILLGDNAAAVELASGALELTTPVLKS
jgi:hypothetical protein